MRKAVFNIMFITIIAKILGFGREILLSYYFGTTGISDAYLISQTIPGTIFQFVGTGLATSFIPVYLRVRTEGNIQKANEFTNTILTAVLLFSVAVIVLVLIGTEPVVNLFASGFEGQTLEYAICFTRIGILSLICSALIYVFNSYLQANEKFFVVAFVAIPNSLMIMLSIILGEKVNILALPIGSLFAVFLQCVVLWVAMRKQQYRVRLNLKFKDPYVLEILRLMIPVIIGVSVNQINVLIDRTIASNVIVGGISALIYADSLIMFVQGIFSQSIITVYYPPMARLVESKNEIELKKIVSDAFGSMSFVLFPITFGCIVLANGIVGLLYGRGAFDAEAISLTGAALAMYGVGIVGYGFREILSRVFYAYHDTKTPMVNAVIGMLINIVLNLSLSQILGIAGLALATSISSTITAVLLFIQLRRKIGTLLIGNIKKEIFKVLMASGIMGLIVFFANKMLMVSVGSIFSTIISILLGVIVYIVLAIMLKVDFLQKILKEIGKRIRR